MRIGKFVPCFAGEPMPVSPLHPSRCGHYKWVLVLVLMGWLAEPLAPHLLQDAIAA